MNFLVDTNVLSEAIRPSPDPSVIAWLDANDPRLWVSAISLGEIERGLLRLASGPRRRRLDAWFRELKETLAGRMLAFGAPEASHWAHYVEEQRAQGRVLPTIDSMIAATARTHGLILATRNTTDFPEIHTVNPWATTRTR